jgi:hypothetical protein
MTDSWQTNKENKRDDSGDRVSLFFIGKEAGMNKQFIFILLILSLMTNGCSGAFGTMTRIMSSWEGATLDEVIAQWGYPNHQQEIAGRKLYIWDKNRTLTLPYNTTGTANIIGNTAYLNTTTSGGTSHWSCRRVLEVDSRNVVVKWQWSGNNCPMGDYFGDAAWTNRNAKQN